MIQIMRFGVVIVLMWMPKGLFSGVVDLHESGKKISTCRHRNVLEYSFRSRNFVNFSSSFEKLFIMKISASTTL